MKKILKDNDEFYVGYLLTAPKGISSFLRKFVFALLSITLLVGVTVVLNQRDFSKSEFEYGEVTTLSGIFMKTPVPRLRVAVGKDLNGEMKYQSVLLVGFGKHGADKVIGQLKSSVSIIVKGYLIYYGGKALLQINDTSDIEQIAQGHIDNDQSFKSQSISIAGEIVDPKCYFGVMKPGEGKAHRSCAIRCIAGGMPPVLHLINSEEYFIILGQRGEELNEKVLSIVGDQIELAGDVREMDDWKVMYVKDELVSKMSTSSPSAMLLAFNDGITICSNH